jgi:hypothetical protein
MSDIEAEIRQRIQAFVAELEGLVRQAAVEAVAHVLGSGGAAGAPRRAGRGSVPAAAMSASRPRRGGKRTAEELEQLSEEIFRYLGAHPGLGVEQLSRSLDVDSKVLTLPIKKLVSGGRLRTEGQKRATKYFVVSEPVASKRSGAGPSPRHSKAPPSAPSKAAAKSVKGGRGRRGSRR